jgi:hypothetical protein
VQCVTLELSSIVTLRVQTPFKAIQFSFHVQNAFSAYASHKVGVRESGGMVPGTLNLGFRRNWVATFTLRPLRQCRKIPISVWCEWVFSIGWLEAKKPGIELSYPPRGQMLTSLDSVGVGLKYIWYLICLTTLVTRWDVIRQKRLKMNNEFERKLVT